MELVRNRKIYMTKMGKIDEQQVSGLKWKSLVTPIEFKSRIEYSSR